MSYARYEHMREEAEESVRSMREEGVHPCLRSHWPERERARCRACGKKFDIDELTEDGLCCLCDAAVKAMEQGRVA